MGNVIIEEIAGRKLSDAEQRLADFVEADPTDGLVCMFTVSWPAEDEPGDPVDVVSLGIERRLSDGRAHVRFVDITSTVGLGLDAWRAHVESIEILFDSYRQSLGLEEVEMVDGVAADYADSAE